MTVEAAYWQKYYFFDGKKDGLSGKSRLTTVPLLEVKRVFVDKKNGPMRAAAITDKGLAFPKLQHRNMRT